MGSYAVSDFSESLRAAGIDPADVKRVAAAWGNIDTDGQCCEACGGEWSGGFVMELKDGRFGTLTGWCDYTGWGCQDGATIEYGTTMPDIKAEWASEIDFDPIDLNLYLRNPSRY